MGDLPCTKKAFVEACGLCTSTLNLLLEMIPSLEVREEKLRAAMTEDLFVTDEVYRRVAAGTPFREAYASAKADFFKKRRGEAEAEERSVKAMKVGTDNQ